MDFAKEYEQKLVSADEAVREVRSGDWVDFGWCVTTPDALDKALAKRTDELTDVKLRGGILVKPLAIFEREDAGALLLEFLAYGRHRAQAGKPGMRILLPDPVFGAAPVLSGQYYSQPCGYDAGSSHG